MKDWQTIVALVGFALLVGGFVFDAHRRRHERLMRDYRERARQRAHFRWQCAMQSRTWALN